MERHLTDRALIRLFTEEATPPEVDAAVAHLSDCRLCWGLAAKAMAQVKRDGRLVRPPDLRGAVLSLLEERERRSVERLRARGWWAELKELSPARQRDRIRSVASLQTLEFFEVVLEESERLGRADPHRGEQQALVAQMLAELLATRRYPEPLTRDLQVEALAVVANCRRLAADWRGAHSAIAEAGGHLKRGPGNPFSKARLLSIYASLCSDTGQLEKALSLLARAASLYRAAGDTEGLARVAVKEASTLFAGGRADEAMARAEEALTLAIDGRLEMLTRSIITESLIVLDRPSEALRSFTATRPLYEQFPDVHLRVAYLEARLLDALGCAREAEKLYRDVVAGNLEAEQYKEGFITMLTFFESLYKRGALEKAAGVCEDALEMFERTGAAGHAQVAQLWRDLLALVRSRALTEAHLSSARHYLVRHWGAPAARAPLELVVEQPLPPERLEIDEIADVQPRAPETSRSLPPMPEAPPVPARLASGGYEEALEQYDRQLLAAALAQCGGRIREATRLLGMSRNTLRAKMKRYGLRWR